GGGAQRACNSATLRSGAQVTAMKKQSASASAATMPRTTSMTVLTVRCPVDLARALSQASFAGGSAMTRSLRQFALTVSIALGCVSIAQSQEWPTREVSVVIPLPPGVASDTTARIVLEQVGRQVGQTFVIHNRPGAGGTIGANVVAKSDPDGYTALVYGSLAAATALYSKLPFDTVNDFAPVVPFGQQPLAIVAPPGRFKNLADLLARARAKPGELNYASAGVGSAAHFGAARLTTSAGIQVQHVPFKGGDYFTEIIAGRVDFTAAPLTTMINLIRDGKVVALAVSAKKRSVLLPQVPTLIEAGLPPDSVYPFYS